MFRCQWLMVVKAQLMHWSLGEAGSWLMWMCVGRWARGVLRDLVCCRASQVVTGRVVVIRGVAGRAAVVIRVVAGRR